MAITHEDMQEIKKVLDDRYVQIADCDSVQDGINKKFANDDKRIDLIHLDIRQIQNDTKNGFKFNNWLTVAVLGALIVGLVGFYYFQFGG